MGSKFLSLSGNLYWFMFVGWMPPSFILLPQARTLITTIINGRRSHWGKDGAWGVVPCLLPLVCMCLPKIICLQYFVNELWHLWSHSPQSEWRGSAFTWQKWLTVSALQLHLCVFFHPLTYSVNSFECILCHRCSSWHRRYSVWTR
jgi:hypothetical protein